MKYISPGEYELEDQEPYFHTCFECDSTHEYLRNVNRLHICPSCGRPWLLGTFTADMTDEEFDSFYNKHRKELEAPIKTMNSCMKENAKVSYPTKFNELGLL